MKVFYNDKQVFTQRTSSPSPRKPPAVLAAWQLNHANLEVVPQTPVTRTQVCIVHSPDYVLGVLSGKLDDGFGLRGNGETFLYTCGSLYQAARQAMIDGMAVSPTSGFHHAGYFDGGGYCTFNGLALTAALMHQEGVRNIGILDCDMHYGDGTDNIIRRMAMQGYVNHWTAGKYFNSPDQKHQFFQIFPGVLERMVKRCDLILYQAGADPHIDDPLGGWLTDVELALRDRMVFQACRNAGVPIAWNLAGGYQKPLSKVVAIHAATMREALYYYN